MDGVVGVAVVTENKIRITFDGLKTDPRRINAALLQGGVAIPGEPKPAAEAPISY